MNHAEHEAAGLAADSDRVRVDVERVRRVAVVVDLHVARVHLRALRERIRVADFPLVRAGVRTLGEAGDPRAVRRATLAVVRAAIEQVPVAGTHGNRAADAPEVALQAAARRVVVETLVHARDAHDAEVVAAGDREVVVVEIGCANLLVQFVTHADLDRAVVVDGVRAEHVRVAQLGRVVAGVGAGGAGTVAQRDLAAERQAVPRRRVVAQRVAETRVEAAVRLRGIALRPERSRRQDRRRVRRDVTEDRVHVVEGHQEMPHLERAPGALQADKGVTAAEVAAVGVAVDARFDLENRVQAAPERLGAAEAEARGVRAETRHVRVRAVRLPAIDEFEVDIQPAVQRDVRSLRMRSQRSAKNARDSDSNELLFH